MAKRIGVILAGCGYLDGSEIQEVVLTLLHLQKSGVKIECFAPDIDQATTVDHKTKEEKLGAKRRNVLEESARIVRGNVHSMFNARAEDLDAIVVPGGFGAAKNLSDFAFRDVVDDMDVELHLKSLIEDMHKARKPMGFLCIAPASVAAVALRNESLQLTCGRDEGIAAKMGLLGHTHVERDADQILVDEDHNIVTTPAYMVATNIAEANEGIEKLVAEVVKRVNEYVEPTAEETAPEVVA